MIRRYFFVGGVAGSSSDGIIKGLFFNFCPGAPRPHGAPLGPIGSPLGPIWAQLGPHGPQMGPIWVPIGPMAPGSKMGTY